MRLSVFPLAVLHDERLLAHVRSELCMLMCGVLCLDASVTIAVVRRVYGVYACSSEKRPRSQHVCGLQGARQFWKELIQLYYNYEHYVEANGRSCRRVFSKIALCGVSLPS